MLINVDAYSLNIYSLFYHTYIYNMGVNIQNIYILNNYQFM